MQNKEILVVYYSKSGFTKKIAEELERILDCDVEEIRDRDNRKGITGYFRSVIEAAFKRQSPIEVLKKDPSHYGLVLVGTPVWGSSMSSPVRTYLVQYKSKLNHVAFFLTQGGKWGRKRVFDQMKDACGKDPVGVLAVRDTESLEGQNASKVRGFLNELSEVVALPQKTFDSAAGH